MRTAIQAGDHRQRLQSLQRGVSLLRVFTSSRPEWGLTELAQDLQLNKTIVHRIVRTFEDEGFLARRDGKYILGPALLDLSSAILNSIDLRQVARPVIERLSAETGETVFLTVVRGDRSVCVEKVESHQRMRLTLDIGGHYPLYAGASNKVLLAFLNSNEQERVLTGPLEAITDKTPQDPKSLRQELASIREAGWCTTTGELTPHATAVAVSVRDPLGEVVGALSISGPESRLTDIEGTVRLLERGATEIGAALLSWRSVAQQGVRTVGRPNQEEKAT